MNFLSGQNITSTFERFSQVHIITLLICVFLLGFIFIRRKTIRRNGSGRWYYLLFAFPAFLSETVNIVWNYAQRGESNIIYAIPFDFTFIAMVLSVLLFFGKKQIFFDLFYFISFFSVSNLILADFGGYGITHFKFYQFFICNIFVVFSLIYFVFIEYHNIKSITSLINYSAFIIFMIGLNGLLTLVSGINYLIPTISLIPKVIYDFAGGVGLMFIMMFLSVLIAFIAYLPWYLYEKNQNNERDTTKENSEKTA